MTLRVLSAAFMAMLMLAGCGLQQDLSSVPNLGNGPTGPATAISAPTLSGTPFSWSSTHDHVVVLDFWGSWCGPCNAEQPDLNKLAAQWMPKDVTFLGVDENESSANGAAYELHYAVPFPSVNDASEVIASEYNVIEPPTVIIIDNKGNIVDRFLGTLTGVSADLTRLTG
ncbi:MAG: TlpA disulfide reductase family protein [Candidatus Dormiibacterota bacterium]